MLETNLSRIMQKVIIIAEAGVNHNGDLNLAKKLVDLASECGADYVKFQTFKAEKLVTKSAKKANYQLENIKSEKNDNQFDMLKKLELPLEWHYDLIRYCGSRNIKFLSTGFDEASIDFLDQLDLDFIKIPSGEITNKPYLEHIAQKNKNIIFSTGMSTLKEIKDCINVLLNKGLSKSQISVLQCNTEYPTPYDDVNLNVLITLRDELGVMIGYSDHTEGINIPIAAVAMGAKLIEKHITLDKNMEGPDHKVSADKEEFENMIKAIRQVEQAFGISEKKPTDSERKNLEIVRKSLHYSRELEVSHIISKEDLIALRPGNGISPMNIDDIIGKKLLTKVNYNDLVQLNDFR